MSPFGPSRHLLLRTKISRYRKRSGHRRGSEHNESDANDPKPTSWSVFSHNGLRGSGLRRHGRDREGDPCGPAFRPVLDGKILVSLQVEIALIAFGYRDDETDLRTDSNRAGLEWPELRPRPAIARELLQEITDQTNMDVLADEL